VVPFDSRRRGIARLQASRQVPQIDGRGRNQLDGFEVRGRGGQTYPGPNFLHVRRVWTCAARWTSQGAELRDPYGLRNTPRPEQGGCGPGRRYAPECRRRRSACPGTRSASSSRTTDDRGQTEPAATDQDQSRSTSAAAPRLANW